MLSRTGNNRLGSFCLTYHRVVDHYAGRGWILLYAERSRYLDCHCCYSCFAAFGNPIVPIKLPLPYTLPDRVWANELVRALETYIVGLETTFPRWTQLPLHWHPDPSASPVVALHVGTIPHWGFGASADQTVFGSAVLPSAYVSGTPIYPIVVWHPLTNAVGTVRWEFESSIVMADLAFPTPAVSQVDTQTLGIATSPIKTDFSPLSGSGIAMPACFTCRLTRKTSGVSGHYSGIVGLTSLHLLVQQDDIGSRERFVR